jgi:uncharacterized protein (UPF0216 family)
MREKKLIKFIQAALKKDHMYSSDELIYMKKELKSIREQFEIDRKNTSKGFGN